jgi:lipoprotein-anchoring transpeptidase ErfK/SrfK
MVANGAWARRGAMAFALAVTGSLLLLSSCSVDAGVNADAASASGTRPDDSTAALSSTSVAASTSLLPTTTTAVPHPSVNTIPAPTTAAPTTTTLPPCPDGSAPVAGACPTTTTAAPVTTVALPPAAQPEPAPQLTVAVQPVKPGNKGDAVKALQQRLTDLGFWVGNIDGTFGFTTTQAVMAFQKYTARPATGSVDLKTAEFLNTAPNRVYATANRGTLVEVDKGRQLLFVIQDGRTVWAVNTSTGSGKHYVEQGVKEPDKTFEDDAITPSGWFKFNRQHEEGWWEGDLGKIYRPKYFAGGIAVHGMTNVPNHPASHGCVRVSVPFMDYVWANNLMPLKMRVWVHGPNASPA